MKLLLFVTLAFNAFAFDHEHKSFDVLLKQNVQIKGNQSFFNYKAVKSDSSLLKAYTNELESVKKSEYKKFTKPQKLAFWINAYNAYTIEIVVKNYPLKSIKDIGYGGFNPLKTVWDRKFIKLGLKKKQMSLNNIEHDTIRKYFKEPRIHFAVNCASMGCPSLLGEAFVASKLDSQLERAAKNFLTNVDKNMYKKDSKELVLSKIFKWYGGDFKPKFGSVEGFASKYIEFPKGTDIEWDDYSWKLNEIKNEGSNRN